MVRGKAERAAVWWTGSSAIWLLILAGLVATHPTLVLRVGDFEVAHATVLAVVVAGALLGFGGVFLLPRGRRLGASVITGYALFWWMPLVIALPRVWAAHKSVCLTGVGVCVDTTTMACVMSALVMSFLLVTAWSGRAAWTA